MKQRRLLAAVLLPATLAIWIFAAPPPQAAAIEAASRAGRTLIEAASMEPVEVALAATSLSQTTEHASPPDAPADLRAVFRIPAAYVARFTDEKQPAGRGWLTLRFWSGSFDPVRPDELADLATCPAEDRFRGCPGRGPDGGRAAARRRAGEYAVTAEVGHTAGTEAHRRYVLARHAGVGGWALGRQPCDTRWDGALGMLVSRAPGGIHPRDACNFRSAGAVSRDGRAFAPAAFLKPEADGAPRFAVRCGAYVAAADEGALPLGCRMLGHHGPWPLIVSVRSDRVAEWADTFDRLSGFLARHEITSSN